MMPTPYELPEWFAVRYQATLIRKTRRERLFDWLRSKFPVFDLAASCQKFRIASAIEARRVETEGLDAQHESAVPQADAQPPIPSSKENG
jgi:hypothetical protein